MSAGSREGHARLSSPSAGTREVRTVRGAGAVATASDRSKRRLPPPPRRIFGLSVAFQLTGHREFHPRPRRGALGRACVTRLSCTPPSLLGTPPWSDPRWAERHHPTPTPRPGDCAAFGEN